MIKYIIITLLLLTPSAQAFELEEGNFADHNKMILSLRASGVEPVTINWVAVNNACLGKIRDKPAYHRCQYDVAMLQSEYQADVRYCNATAEQDYFDYERSNLGITVINNSSDIFNPQTKNKLTKADKRRYKRNAYKICMSETDWKNPSNYLIGKE